MSLIHRRYTPLVSYHPFDLKRTERKDNAENTTSLDFGDHMRCPVECLPQLVAPARDGRTGQWWLESAVMTPIAAKLLQDYKIGPQRRTSRQ